MSITLSIVWGALGVCKVASMRCPVSAAVNAMLMI